MGRSVCDQGDWQISGGHGDAGVAALATIAVEEAGTKCLSSTSITLLAGIAAHAATLAQESPCTGMPQDVGVGSAGPSTEDNKGSAAGF